MQNKQTTDYLALLDRALRFARKNLSPDIPAQRLLLLNAPHFDSTSSTALSRNMADLSAMTTRKVPGPDLLELRTDPLNLRIKRVFLTSRGKRFVRRWLAETAGKKTAGTKTSAASPMPG